MIDEKELERVCRLGGLIKITTAKVPTYRTSKGDAAVELTKDGLKAFWFTEGERDYVKTMDDGKICSVLGAFEKEQSKYEEIIKDGKKVGEKLKDANIGILEDKTTMPADSKAVMIPDSLTMELLEKWRAMKTEARMFMFQNTARDYVSERQGMAGMKLKYVKGNVMVQELNIAFLFNWSSTIEEVKETETGFWVRGYIEVWMGQETGYIKRSAIGTADKHKGVNSEDVAKAAAMDMIKKAASFLGFNGDVYRGEV